MLLSVMIKLSFSCDGTTGRIGFYNFDSSKYEVAKSLTSFVEKNLVYIPPEKRKKELISYHIIIDSLSEVTTMAKPGFLLRFMFASATTSKLNGRSRNRS